MSALAVSAHTELTALFGPIGNLESATAAILDRVPVMTDAELESAIYYSAKIEEAGWLIRARCLAEFKLRATRMQGKKDEAGEGITARITRYAAELGLAESTLFEDLRIAESMPANLLQRDVVSLSKREILAQIKANGAGNHHRDLSKKVTHGQKVLTGGVGSFSMPADSGFHGESAGWQCEALKSVSLRLRGILMDKEGIEWTNRERETLTEWNALLEEVE